MKNYTHYMNNISVDAELHDKIVKRATKGQMTVFQRRTAFHYAGCIACAAILLVCVWMIPGLLNNSNIPDSLDKINNSNPNIVSSGDPQSDEQIGTVVSDDPSDPNGTTYPLYALTLNRADSQLGASIYIPGHFWYELTNEQLKAVLIDFTFPISATANYRGDGSLFNVVAYEISAVGDIARFNDLYRLTEIQIAPSEISEDVIYEYEPKTSDVYGIPVVAGVFDFEKNDGVALYTASFKIGGIAYSIKLHDNDNGENGLNRLTEIVNTLIRKGSPDLTPLNNPVIPELRDEKLTLIEARSDPDFGAYLPEIIPSAFKFDSAQRFINQSINGLFVHWYAGLDYIEWRISIPTEYDRKHIVSTSDREKYDLSLYPIPRADSIPRELWVIVNDPVFLAEELTLEVIQARAYYVDNDRGDTPGWRMDFSVLYDGVLIKVNIKGASPEQAFEIFAELMK